MAPPSWATKEQTEFLCSKLNLFFDHQKKNTVPMFWPPLFSEWSRKWPEQATGTIDAPVSEGDQDGMALQKLQNVNSISLHLERY